jgi:uncharacterized protein (DUF427 family)
MKATWNDTVLAESANTIEIEGNQYFPPDSVHWDALVESPTQTTCPWKGTASYYTVAVGGERLEDAVWTYRDPLPAAREIAGYVAFWKGVQVTDDH